MTTPNTDLSLDAYAVVWFGGLVDTPQVCKGMSNGVNIDGTNYAIFSKYQDAVTEFNRWPHSDHEYGIVPARLVLEPIPPQPRYRLKSTAK